MKNEFTLAFNEVLEEKQLPQEVVLEALEAAMVSAYRRAVNASNAQHVAATIDPTTGQVMIYAEKEVVDFVQDPRTEVTLEEACRVDPEAQLGGMVIVETTPNNFGRVAAQTARQVIQQRIREAEREAQTSHFSHHQGEILSGMVQAVNPSQVTVGLDMKAEGVMPRQHQIPGERFRIHDRVRALLLEVKTSPRGPQITLSRAHRNFLRRLLENEVPEIYQGMVEIRSIAREPGQRSKVAVAGLQPGVDPVGACVGIKGVRIQAIVRELNDEKIDVIEWSADPAIYIAKALSPARVSGVYLNEQSKGAKTATVIVPEDQLSLAIGRDGQNARLAAKLTSWKIDIKSQPEAARDAIDKLNSDSQYAMLAEHEIETIPQVEAVLTKKAEGRPVTPEEYQLINQFVDRVERGILEQRQAEKIFEDEREHLARATIPAAAFEIPLEKFEVSDRVYAVISEAGFPTVGELMYQMSVEPDSILRLAGMGPKGMKELEDALGALRTQLEAEEAGEAVIEPEAVELPAETAAVFQAEGEQPTTPETVEAQAAEITLGLEPVALEAELQTVAGEEGLVITEPEAELEPVLETAPAAAGDEKATFPEDIFAFSQEMVEYDELYEEEDEDEDEDSDKKKKKKKKKKKFTQYEYDPDKDVMIAKKQRKRDGTEWDENWKL